MRDAFARALGEAARTHPDIALVVADISPAASLKEFLDENPTRIVDVGVSEQAMIGMAAGMAIAGLRPFAYTIAPFAIFRPFEQIRIDLAYQQLPVVIVGVGGGLAYSALGSTHHTLEDIAVATAIPTMTVIAPCDPLETAAAVHAVLDLEGPCYLRLGKAGEPVLTDNAVQPFAIGTLRQVTEGHRVAIVGYGPILRLAFDARARLTPRDQPAIFSAHTLKPLDIEGIDRLLSAFDRVIVLEEHVARGGLGREVVARSRTIDRADIACFHLKDEFLHVYGSQEFLWAEHGLTVEALVRAIVGEG